MTRVWLATQGLFIGFGGRVPSKGAKRAAKAISALPLDAIVLETDCPLHGTGAGARHPLRQLPHPLCGEYIAQLRGISAEEVFRTTVANARRVFGL